MYLAPAAEDTAEQLKKQAKWKIRKSQRNVAATPPVIVFFSILIFSAGGLIDPYPCWYCNNINRTYN